MKNYVPEFEAADLFKSVEKKIPKCLPSVRVQGAWISVGVALDERDLLSSFDSLSHEKIHFAIISTGGGSAYTLARTPEIRAFVMRLFQLTHNPMAIRSAIIPL